MIVATLHYISVIGIIQDIMVHVSRNSAFMFKQKWIRSHLAVLVMGCHGDYTRGPQGNSMPVLDNHMKLGKELAGVLPVQPLFWCRWDPTNLKWD